MQDMEHGQSFPMVIVRSHVALEHNKGQGSAIAPLLWVMETCALALTQPVKAAHLTLA